MAEAHPVGFRWVMKAARARRARSSTSTRASRARARLADLHVPIRAGHRHRVPRRADPPRARDRVVLQGVRRPLHERRDDRQRGLPGHRGPRRRASPASTPRPATYDPHDVDVRGRRGRRRRPACASTRRRRSSEHDRRRACSTGDVERDETLAAPALRLPDPAAATSRATRRRWSSASAASRSEQFLAVAEALIANSGPRAHDRVLLRRRLDAAHRRRADDPRRRDPAAAARQHRPARAAASWRCAGTRRSRARPTSRRSTTCCPATCRCRAPREERARRSRTTSTTGGADRGWWSNFDKYIVSLLKAWFGDAATRGERLRLRAPAEDHRQPLALPDDAARARRRRSTGSS